MGSLTQMPATPESRAGGGGGADACRVELLCRVPGVQTILQCGDCTVCTSVIAPTTLVWESAASASSGEHSAGEPLLVELDELEAEQSTCAVALRSEDGARVRSLVEGVIPEATRDASWLLVLQGDADGGVRYSLVSTTTARVGSAASRRSGKLMEIGEPVQFIAPFVSSATKRSGVLIVGASGCARLLLSNSSSSKNAALSSGVPIAFGAPVQSVVFVESQDCFVYCSKGVVFGFRVCDLVARSASSLPTPAHTEFATKLPFRVVRFADAVAVARGAMWSHICGACLGSCGHRAPRRLAGAVVCVQLRACRIYGPELGGGCDRERSPSLQSRACR